MAKAVRWQIPFVSSIEKTQYRIDIYDEQDGTWSGVTTLTGGPSPIVTDEDASDDFFAPIRTQTGNIEVCTAIPGGGTLSLEDILPENNIARPVRLVSIDSDTEEESIEWAGFLSCEVYSQDYVGYPQVISLPVISRLEAMRSIELNINSIPSTLLNIGYLVALILESLPQEVIFEWMYFPKSGRDIFRKTLINISNLFKKETYINQEYSTYTLKGDTLYDVIESICTFMGWTCREYKSDIYFTVNSAYGNLGIDSPAYIKQEGGFDDYWYDEPVPQLQIEDLIPMGVKWMGTNHKKSVIQGSQDVKIESSLEDIDVNIEIPDFPYVDFDIVDSGIGVPSMTDSGYKVYMIYTYNYTAHDYVSFNFYQAGVTLGQTDIITSALTPCNIDDVIYNSIPYANTSSPAYQNYIHHDQTIQNFVGAFYARLEVARALSPNNMNIKSGIYVSLLPGSWKDHTSYNQPILSMKSVQVLASFEDGYLVISGKFTSFSNTLWVAHEDPQCRMMWDLRVGDMYWDGTAWLPRDSASHFFIEYDNAKGEFKSNWNNSMQVDPVDGYIVPIPKEIDGDVELVLYPQTKFFNRVTSTPEGWRPLVAGVFFEELAVTYYPPKMNYRNDRSVNTYYSRTGGSFSANKTISSRIASFFNNKISPSILYRHNGYPLEKLEFNDAIGNTYAARPEEDLLSRMVQYYSKSRTILKLELSPLDNIGLSIPNLRLGGINDGKVYVPVAESRDWRAEKSTLTCFEIPN